MRWQLRARKVSTALLTALWAATGVGCARPAGSAAPSVEPRSAGERSTTTGASAASAVSAAPPRTPSERSKRYWHLGPYPASAGYVDLAGLGKALGPTLGSALLSRFEGELDQGKQGCLRVFGERAQSLLFVAGAGQMLAIVELDDDAATRELESACVGTLLARETTSFAGVSNLHAFDHWQVAFEPGVVLLGDLSLVAAAVSGMDPLGSESRELPSGLVLARDEQLVLASDRRPQQTSGHCGILPDRLSCQGASDFGEPQLAAFVESQVRQARKLIEQQRPDLLPLYDAVVIEQRGSRLQASFELRAGPEAQVAAVAGLGSGFVQVVRNYYRSADMQQGRFDATRLSQQYRDYVNRSKPALARLFSLPAVPAQVPAGGRVKTTPKDWKAWDRIQFAVSEPRFQYQVVAAPDGKSAVIHVRGDLDGDGKLSDFRIPIAFEPETGRFDEGAGIEHVDPEE